MAKPKQFSPHKLIFGIIINSQFKDKITSIETQLQNIWGEIDFKSDLIPFDKTDYYQNEMGNNLIKYFISFKDLINPSELYKIKLMTNKIEEKYMKNNNRKINFDPGIMNDVKFILATAKDFFHRIPLKKGIFAETTLYYSKGKFIELPWTYPDFKSDSYKKILNSIRIIYKNQIKEIKDEKN